MGRLPGQTGAIFHFRPYGQFPGRGTGSTMHTTTGKPHAQCGLRLVGAPQIALAPRQQALASAEMHHLGQV